MDLSIRTQLVLTLGVCAAGLAALGGSCGPARPQCRADDDCLDRTWNRRECAVAEGAWRCVEERCVSQCNAPCVDPAECEDEAWPNTVNCAVEAQTWACPAGYCRAECAFRCSEAAECEGRLWPPNAPCTEAEGRWACRDGACVANCDAPECTVRADCEGNPWPVDVVDCLEADGHWTCDAGTCVAVCDQCSAPIDCADRTWTIDCDGHWGCADGACEMVCDMVGCGDGTCDTAGGETVGSCAIDCGARCSAPVDCVDLAAWDLPCQGRWSCEAERCVATCDYATCGDDVCAPESGEDAEACAVDCRGTMCQWPDECTHLEWSKICQGRHTCFLGQCQQTCDSNGCGNGTCDDVLGETSESCFKDCLGGPCEDAADCLGYRWYEAECPAGGYWACRQPAGACEAVCDDVECGDGTCDPLAGEAATGCPGDCQGWDCDVTEDCAPLALPGGCSAWLCVHRNCAPVCP